ncbi:mechanosensitive ion channel family protein [Marivirga aurantiaca]|uniref:mechanosensitive ion channel family protein n=1 Tax=Marivirga aurantiaca TaxID=2802615 RepID=UPI001F42C1CB|nr:mechanosensitive ion channel family protein [Marivirga aurantiaca]
MLVFIQDSDPTNIDVSKPITQVTSKLESWLDALINMIPNMLVAIILFIAFLLLAKLIKKLFNKIFKKSSDNKAVENLLSTIIYYLIIGLGLFIILGILKLDKAVTSLLAGIGVLGLALGFAFQDIAANFVSGIILAFRKPFVIGDIVKIEGFMGTVTRTNLRVTVVQTFQGQEVYIPNKEVLSNPIINYTVLGERRIDLTVGISYGDDLDKVQELVIEAIKNIEGVIRKDDIIFSYKEFGDSSINFDIKYWFKYPGDYSFFDMRSNAIMAIKSAFDKSDITIPFPIRTLDFGVKGGEKLSDMKLGNGGDTSES